MVGQVQMSSISFRPISNGYFFGYFELLRNMLVKFL